MIRHCVLFKWNDEVDDAKRAAFREGLVELLETHEAVRGFAHGNDAAINAGNHDYAVTVDFDDEAGFVSYRDDGATRPYIASKVPPHLESRAAVQFEYWVVPQVSPRPGAAVEADSSARPRTGSGRVHSQKLGSERTRHR